MAENSIFHDLTCIRFYVILIISEAHKWMALMMIQPM